MEIKKAVKYAAPLRMAIYGPAGSGKTYSSLSMARELTGDKRICLIDSERGSASKYADIFDFDVIELRSFHPHTYIEAIKMVMQAGCHNVLIIDSMTHEWDGTRGILEIAGAKFQNWEKATPLHNAFIDMILDAPIHIIATMRAKEKFEMVTPEGKSKPEVQKLGMEAIQGKHMQYEFDVVGSLDMDNILTIQKTRCSALKGGIFPFPGKKVVDILIPWLLGESAPVRMATPDQISRIKKGYQLLSKAEDNLDNLTFDSAEQIIEYLLLEYKEQTAKKQAS
jgi:hypothetical protein